MRSRRVPLAAGACEHIRRQWRVVPSDTGEGLEEVWGAYCCAKKGMRLGDPGEAGNRIDACMAGGPCPHADVPDKPLTY